MTDEDLPEYAAIHCRTPRALFHTSHLRRLFEIAGEEVPDQIRRDGFISAYADVLDDIIAKAKKNQREATMTNERQLHCYTNATDTASAYSVDDARDWYVTEHDTAPEDIGDLTQVPDDKVLRVRNDDAPPPSIDCCATAAMVDANDRPSVGGGHHRLCGVACQSKTAREWANEGRGIVCSTEW